MLYDKLKDYSENGGIYPFHMPGHKRNFEDADLIPYKIDLTEVEGFDNLHDSCGIIKQVEEKASKVYSVKKAFLLVNGTTGGVLASIRALTKYGDKVIVARNCHKSVYNAIELCRLNPVYVMPNCLDECGIYSDVSAKEIEKLIIENPDTKLVVLTSPTYEGIVSDIKSISSVCKKYGVKLLVDQAHGAHLQFSDSFPSEAVSNGADVAVVSLHKTLPALTQTALLLTNDLTAVDRIQENINIFESSSPSYILMSSIDKCIDFLYNSKNSFNDYIENLRGFYSRTKNLKNLKVLYSDDSIKEKIFDYDIGKIIILTENLSLTGTKLAEILRNEYKIETEMAYSNYVIAMTSVCDSKEGFNRLIDALLAIDKICNVSYDNNKNFGVIKSVPEKVFNPSKKLDYSSERILLNSASNRVSLEYIWAYPPGVPIIAPGEIISEEIITTIEYLKNKGVNIYSCKKNAPEFISVAEI